MEPLVFAFKILITFLSALGFAFFFNVRKTHVLSATIGGVITWLIFYALNALHGELFLPTLIASIFAAIYSEVLSRLSKAPTSVFFIISIIPLVPGRGLYYTMSYAVSANWAECSSYALATFEYAAGIALGICIVTAFVQTWRSCKAHIRKRQMKRERKRLGRRRHESTAE